MQRVFVTAHDIIPTGTSARSAFQEFVDRWSSKTCNFAREATEEEVREIYIKTYDLNCKGIRHNCEGADLRAGQAAATSDGWRRPRPRIEA